MILLAIAAVAFALLVVAWVLYPLAMWLRARSGRARSPQGMDHQERVVVLVATRDDPAFALERVRNLRAGDYPAHLLRVLLAVDANAPFALDAYRVALSGMADVVGGDAPGGKAATLNAAVRAVGNADVLVFADVGQEFNTAAIRHMVSALRDEGVGAVTGRYTHDRQDEIMSAYANFEAVIRAGQAAGRSVVSASGSILAMRPALWRDLPAGLICDDLFTGLSVVKQGSRVGFCREAIAYDPREFSRDQQFTRRVRTLTGLIQYCVLQPGALVPWSNPVWSHFMVHKVLRLLTPILLAIGFASVVAWLAWQAPHETAAVTLGGVLAGLLVRGLAPVAFRRARDQFAWALRLMLVPVLAMGNGIRGQWTVWTPTSQVRANLRVDGGA